MRCSISMLVFALVFAVSCAVQAQPSYPSKPIRIIVPMPPGQTLDIMSRIIGPKLSEGLGQPIVVDNRAGAAGQLGLDLGAHAAPDGYTLVGGQGGNLVVEPHTYRKLPYDPLKDFAPIALSATNYMVLVVNPSLPFRSLQDLIAHAKANPGKLSFGSNGEGGWPHMSIEMLRVQAGFEYLHVPYKGSSQITAEILGGRIQATIMGVGSMAPYIRSGKVRLLAVTNPTRVEQFPDAQTFAEVLPGYDSRGWFGYLGPAGTPAHVVRRLNQEINRVMTIPDIKEKMNAIGLTVVAESPEFFAQMLKSDYDKYGKLIKSIGLQIHY